MIVAFNELLVDSYITLNNVGNEEYFAPQKDAGLIFTADIQYVLTPVSFLNVHFQEPDFPIVPTKILMTLNSVWTSGKIISFCGGNNRDLLVMIW